MVENHPFYHTRCDFIFNLFFPYSIFYCPTIFYASTLLGCEVMRIWIWYALLVFDEGVYRFSCKCMCPLFSASLPSTHSLMVSFFFFILYKHYYYIEWIDSKHFRWYIPEIPFLCILLFRVSTCCGGDLEDITVSSHWLAMQALQDNRKANAAVSIWHLYSAEK